MSETTEILSIVLATVNAGLFIGLIGWLLHVAYEHAVEMRRIRYEPSYGCPVCDLMYRAARSRFIPSKMDRDIRALEYHWQNEHGD